MQRDQLEKIWNAGKSRRQYVGELHLLYSKNWEPLLRRELRRRFLDEGTFNNLRLVGDRSVNLAKWTTDKIAAIYSKSPKRSISGEPLPPQYAQVSDLNLSLDRACKYAFFLREVFLRPVFFERNGETIWTCDILLPSQVEVQWSASDPLSIEWILYQCGDQYTYHDDFLTLKLDNFFNVIEEIENPLTMIPVVPVHAEYPLFSFWHHEESDGLVSATYETAIGLTQLRYLLKMQSFKQIAIKGQIDEKTSKLVADPGRALLVPHGDIEIVDWTGPFAELLETILNQAAFALARYGIRPDVIRGTTDASSGYALEIKQFELERQWEQQRSIWRIWEQHLYELVRAQSEVMDLGWEWPNGQFEIEFAEIGAGRDPSEQADLAQKLQAAGFSQAAVFREVFGKSDEWIAQNKLERMSENPMIPNVDIASLGLDDVEEETLL